MRQAVRKRGRKAAMHYSKELGLNDRTARRILKHDLRFHSYKIQVVQALNAQDHNTRLRFCQHMLTLINENEYRVHNLWMSDEAHFHLQLISETI